MSYVVIGAAALGAALLTLFSGFGLGTLLMPAFALFFPPEAAVALTAVVHLANNLFKLLLLGRHADRPLVLRFGLPSIVGAAAGAGLLVTLSGLGTLAAWPLLGRTCEVTSLKLTIAALMLGFVAFELWAEERVRVPPRLIPLGGLVSGFFGGLSGHQGALRAAVLVRAGLSKEAFVATGVVVACLVDLTRLSVYSEHLGRSAAGHAGLLAWAGLCAFAGTFAGSRLITKITMASVRGAVAAMMALIAVLLGSGIL
ncbi:MAG: sulfite exporter TauE/SafE family protein [Elusimicrobia bacterium]|nr:sulfite exporter TauE/SafE family protein [Elusimicrobiota bacterium]